MYYFEISNGGSNLSANTWTKITHTIPGDSGLAFDSDNSNGLAIGIFPFEGTNYTTSGHSLNTWAAWNAGSKVPDMDATWWETDDATFALTGVQLEVGDVATDFEHRSYGDELARCQRYYFKLVSGIDELIGLGENYGDPDFFAEVTFPVTMRAAPSLDITTGTNYYQMHQNNSSDNMNSFVISRANTNKCNLYDGGSGGSAGMGGMLITNNASASVAFKAEL